MKKLFVLLALGLPTAFASADCNVNAFLRGITYADEVQTASSAVTPLSVEDTYRLMCLGDVQNPDQLFQQALANIDSQTARLQRSRLVAAGKRYYNSFYADTRELIQSCQAHLQNGPVRPASSSPLFEVQLGANSTATIVFLSPRIMPNDLVRNKGTNQAYIANDLRLYGDLGLCDGQVRMSNGQLVE